MIRVQSRRAQALKGNEPRRGRPPVIENARGRIVTEAANLFAKRGYDIVTLADVAHAIGASKAAVYHYFSTKQQIYDEIIHNTLSGLLGASCQSLVDADHAEDQLRCFMRAHARYFEQHHGAFVTLLIGFGSMADPKLKRESIQIRSQYETSLRQIIERGVASGEFRDLDVAVAARAILSMLNWMARWFKPGAGKAAEEFAEEYFSLLASGLRAAR